MTRTTTESDLATSPSSTESFRARLAAVIPEAFSEGRLDVAALKRLLGDAVAIEGGERYALNWAGKDAAYKVLQAPTTATLRPERDKSVNFDDAQHVFIEGENLEVLKVLQKSYFGKVKLIYIDPPYNTGSDSFIYPDRYQESKEDYLKRINDLADDGTLMREGFFRKNSKESGHYHSNWLSMMLPRIYIARSLLRDDGAMFISCDDNEIHNLRVLTAEIFGEENVVGIRVWQKGTKSSKLIGITHEYMLVVARNKAALLEAGAWRKRKDGVDEVLAKYREMRDEHGEDHQAIEAKMRAWYAAMPQSDVRKAHAHYKNSDDRGLYFAADFSGPDDGRESRPRYDIKHPTTKKPSKIPSTGWRWEEARTKKALALKPSLIHFGADHTTIPCRKSYLHVVDSAALQSVFYKDGRSGTLLAEGLIGKGVFDFPKDVDTLQEMISAVLYPKQGKLASSEDDEEDGAIEPPRFDEVASGSAAAIADLPIVLDFFGGSGSTAQAAIQASLAGHPCRFILVQLPETTDRGGFKDVAEVARARIRKFLDLYIESTGSNVNLESGLGFKSFKLAPSNFKKWRGEGLDTAEQLADQIALFASSEKDGAAVEDVLFELLLKFGQGLTAPIETVTVGGQEVFAIDNRKMLFVLRPFTKGMVAPLVKIKPREIVVVDGVFKGLDMLKTNLELQCRDAGIRFTCL